MALALTCLLKSLGVLAVLSEGGGDEGDLDKRRDNKAHQPGRGSL